MKRRARAVAAHMTDADTKDERRGLGAQFLADAGRLQTIFAGLPRCQDWNIVSVSLEREVPIYKGGHQDKTVVGFLCGRLNVTYNRRGNFEFERQHLRKEYSVKCGVQTKIAVVSAADILAQIQAYRDIAVPSTFHTAKRENAFPFHDQQLSQHSPFFVLCTFELPEPDVENLLRHDIVVIQLGPQFDEWVRIRETIPATPFSVF